MFLNYVKIALRNILKNKLYAAINILGLAIGLTVYLFGGIVAEYEYNHDTMFPKHERTFTIGSILSPTANIGVNELNNTYTAMGPLIKADVESVEEVARTVRRGYLVTNGDKHFYKDIQFADKELTSIFDFTYIHGDASALSDPRGMIITASAATQIFGTTDVVGETILLNHEEDLRVRAVVEDLPQNSHFNSFFIIDQKVEFFVPLEALNRMAEWDLNGNWNNLSGGNYVYVLMKDKTPVAEVTRLVDEVYKNHADQEMQETFITGMKARALKETNTAVWDMIGMPAIETVQLLGVLVLVIAIVNYTNLATAQSMGRVREVGMRKTLGASRKQLLLQFLIESVTIATVAMVVAIVCLELLVPLFNDATGKVVSFNYLQTLPWLVTTTLVVGFFAGLYPSYLITKVSPIDALKEMTLKGGRGSWFRSLMIGTQFMLSIFMLAVVLIVFFQNKKVEESSNIYPKEEVLVLKRLNVESIREREETLRQELLNIPEVESVSFATQVPFEQSNSTFSVTPTKGDEAAKFQVNQLDTDHDFMKTFDVPFVAGRDFDRAISADVRTSTDVRRSNVIINEMAARNLGYARAADAVGQTFWGLQSEEEDAPAAMQFDIIGVVEDQNILGLHNDMKAWIFAIDPVRHFYAAVRINRTADASVILKVEDVWKQVIPEYPIEHDFLVGMFNDVYQIYKAMNSVLAGFAFMALLLALIGLFGLAAFMARGRTKELGIRKVLGASIPQLVKLLIWQFSKPVMWAILVALPLAYFASDMYLNFFADRINTQIVLILVAGAVAVSMSWGVIGLHAIKVARGNPITALRYE
ncbi:ABC transporter permease [Kordiimonas sediminis]|uniref:ABC transporter permease n=1 Tax=Kordiimonas sediminis TaxID=1735581 RepID=A0A919AQB4_9PROT|nr:ABC transporter permease [Kordiimonas sediminis]GHF19946.1 ABC transporter permease [Kordiimonas sediminis]